MNFTDTEGNHHQRSTGTFDLETAGTILEKLKAKIALNLWHPEQEEKRPECTFRELAEQYKEYKISRLKGKHSIDNEACTLKMLVAKLGKIELGLITTQRLEQLQTDMLAKGLAAATVNRKFDILNNMFTKAVDWDMADESILKRARRVKDLPMHNRRLRYLSREECQTLINTSDPHLTPIIITALNTGMRKGEILGLTWDNVDLKHGFILLDKTKNGERREIPINSGLRATLQDITRRLDVPYVFYAPSTGKPYGNIRKSFASALLRAKIHDFKFHDLRHTFASQLVMTGVDITTVSKLLGHKSLTMTLRYAHLSPAHNVEAVRKLDMFYTPKAQQKQSGSG